MNYQFIKTETKVSDLVKKIDSQDLLFNRASKDTIAESYLGCYDILGDDNKKLYTLIVPDLIIHNMIKLKYEACHKESSVCEIVKESLVLTEEEYAEFEHTRFMIDKYEYIGDSTEDIIIEKYISQIDPFDDDSDLNKILKETLSKHIHAITDEKRKYWLTQLYSRIRRNHTPVEDKNSVYTKLKWLEQYSEGGLYITTKIRRPDGRLEDITYQIKL